MGFIRLYKETEQYAKALSRKRKETGVAVRIAPGRNALYINGYRWEISEPSEIYWQTSEYGMIELKDLPQEIQDSIESIRLKVWGEDIRNEFVTARKVGDRSDEFALRYVQAAMAYFAAHQPLSADDTERYRSLIEQYPPIPDHLEARILTTGTGGVPCRPNDFPIYHKGSWKKYRTSNGDAYGGEFAVLLPKGQPAGEFCREGMHVYLLEGKVYVLEDGRKFKVWERRGSPSSFDDAGVSWV